ncbi:MAG: NADH-quinone oxidoreductase subunit L [Bacteroidales bacterium]|nr:NADH-quinone oxidoreductase subunit L [Bacteroidales bacterium]
MEYTLFILLLPLLSFLLIGVVDLDITKTGRVWSHKMAGLIGTTSLALVTILSYLTAFQYFTAERLGDGTFPTIVPYNITWLPFGSLHFDLGILLDPISVMMLVVISTVSLMVHLYSFGYMHGERGFQRYYAYLSLFTMSMLGLVLATNIFQMYLFWELVGVSSYLLIGFYYTSPAAIAASKKAFIVTRFADMFFLVGILIFGYFAHSFNFSFAGTIEYAQGATMFQEVMVSKEIAAAGLLIPTALVLMFIGGAGKSAMFPLHIWLPDAMEGPTPVSALIHAATMVVAGVFQIARMFPMWMEYAPDSLSIVVWIGAFTAFYAAAVAMVQSDIKRVLAFSTISQIAFMMVSLGVCLPGHGEQVIDNHASLGYMASMFHLFTHAMFKACLFLGAGAIIHAVHSNEMRDMGGLRKYMPITHVTFLVSCLAIAGIPGLSGFFSKDEIITAAFAYSPFLGWWMTAVAAMTAFYMFRLYYGIFWGKDNSEAYVHHTPHEGPWTMTLPLIVLTLITLFAGWMPFGHFVSATGEAYDIHLNLQVAITSSVIAVLSIALATYIYKGKQQPVAERLQAFAPRLHRWAYKRFYMDEVYQYVTHRVIFRRISQPIAWFDKHIIDGFFDFLAWGTQGLAQLIKGLQSGKVQQYAYVYLLGVVLILILLLF